MSRTLVITIAIGLAAVASVIVWTALPEDPVSQSEPASSITPSRILAAPDEDEADRSAHRERFFEGDPNRDVRGGQEMRPQW